MDRPMEILFCDLCNESVPQSDLERQRAFRLKGRVICSECDKAMSGVRRAPMYINSPVANRCMSVAP